MDYSEFFADMFAALIGSVLRFAGIMLTEHPATVALLVAVFLIALVAKLIPTPRRRRRY